MQQFVKFWSVETDLGIGDQEPYKRHMHILSRQKTVLLTQVESLLLQADGGFMHNADEPANPQACA